MGESNFGLVGTLWGAFLWAGVFNVLLGQREVDVVCVVLGMITGYILGKKARSRRWLIFYIVILPIIIITFIISFSNN